MAIIMEGKSVSANIKADVAKEIEKLKKLNSTKTK